MLVAEKYHLHNFDEQQWIGERGQHLIFCTKLLLDYLMKLENAIFAQGVSTFMPPVAAGFNGISRFQ